MHLSYNLNPYTIPNSSGSVGFPNSSSSTPMVQAVNSNVLPTSLVGAATSLLQPAGFDNLVDSLGIGKIFGQRSKDQFAQYGAKRMGELMGKFQYDVKNDISGALNALSKGINEYKADLQFQLNKASSNRTKQGLPLSIADMVKGQQTFEGIVSAIEKDYDVKRTNLSGMFKNVPYQYSSFIVGAKQQPIISKVKNLFSTDRAPSSQGADLVSGEELPKKNNWYVWVLILLVPFGLLIWLFKLIFKK